MNSLEAGRISPAQGGGAIPENDEDVLSSIVAKLERLLCVQRLCLDVRCEITDFHPLVEFEGNRAEGLGAGRCGQSAGDFGTVMTRLIEARWTKP